MGYATAKAISADAIPIIDCAPLADGSVAGARAVGAAMLAAAETVGFWTIKNHGVPAAVLADVDRIARRFFARSAEEKEQCRPVDRHRGFLSVGQAKMSPGAKIDLKESFIWGLDVPADDPDVLAGNRMHGVNRWPAFLPEMRAAFNAWFDAANACGVRLLRAFAASLDIEQDYFVRGFTKPITRGTVIYYPPQPPEAGEDQFGVAPHTDYGVLTLLVPDDTGGLQVYANREWVAAPPIPGTIVVNVGDLLARWTNDRFKSTPHRVVNSSGRERLSIAAFVDPDFDTPIAPVVRAGDTARYPTVSAGEYILGRFDKSFAYRAKA